MTINNRDLIINMNDIEKKEICRQYFHRFIFYGGESYIEALDIFAKKIGYSISDFEGIFFQEELDEWEQEYDLLKGRNVGLSIEPPAYEEGVFLVMSFEEFYGHLVDTAKLVCEKYPEVENEVYENLEKVRAALEVE